MIERVKVSYLLKLSQKTEKYNPGDEFAIPK
jgi:hypothetical protein